MSSVNNCVRFAVFSSVLVLQMEPQSSSTGKASMPSSVMARPPGYMFLEQDRTVGYVTFTFGGRAFTDF